MAFGCAKSEARFPGRSGFLAAGQPYSIVFSFFMNTVPVAILIHFVILPLILFIAFLVLFPLKFTGKVWARMTPENPLFSDALAYFIYFMGVVLSVAKFITKQ
jgi:hypothetical protein